MRLKPHDVSTESGRSAERYRRVIVSAVSSAMSQVITTGVSFLMVPIALGYLGAERYGLWITLTSLLSMFGFADLGLGNGLLNAVGEAHGKDDQDLAGSYVSTGFYLLCGMAAALLLAGVGVILIWEPNWMALLNIQSALAGAEAESTVSVLFLGFLLALPLSVAQRVRMGYQQVYINSVVAAVGSVLGLLGVILAVSLDGGLPWIAGSVIAAPLIAQLSNTAFLLREKPWILPRWSLFRPDKAKVLLRIGLLFFVLQLAFAVGYTTDNLVIARIVGSEAVTSYAVPQKLFHLAPMVLGFVLTPLWPAYREASTRGDVSWIKGTLKRSLQIGFVVSAPAAVALVALGRPLVTWWSDGVVLPSTALLIALGTLVAFNAFVAPTAMFLNGMNVVGFQVICAIAMAVLNLGFSILFVRMYGVVGVVYGSLLAQVLCVLIPSALYIPRFLTRLQEADSGLGQGAPS
jgi:O-antigen/teichoic acid export membrane protein